MKMFLIEECQKTSRWSRAIKHVCAVSAIEAKKKFAYILDGAASGMFLRAHELKYDEHAEVAGHEDCADCYGYLRTSERYVCTSCGDNGLMLSKFDLAEGQGQVNCEHCNKPLVNQSRLKRLQESELEAIE
jgi:DNA-directed RNA polymerase subunit RPC12/RpoP